MPLTAPRGVRKVNESIAQEGRTFIITEEDDTKLDWSEIPDGTLKINPIDGMMSVKLQGETTWVPAVLRNDGTICIAKDSKISIEVFTIKIISNGDGTFTYINTHGLQIRKMLRILFLTTENEKIIEPHRHKGHKGVIFISFPSSLCAAIAALCLCGSIVLTKNL